MIKKISKINDLAVFKNFDWDASVVDKNGSPFKFEKINILYGRNYSGKTTLSRIVRSLETKQRLEKYDGHHYEIICDDGNNITEDSLNSLTTEVRVFNEDFVRENLHFLIDPNSEITPFAILGSDNDRLQEEIDVLVGEIGNSENGNETGLYKLLLLQKQQYSDNKREYDRAERDLETKLSNKATNRINGIKYQSAKFGDQNYNITKIKSDISVVNRSDYIVITPAQKAELEFFLSQTAMPVIQTVKTPLTRFAEYVVEAEKLITKRIGTSNKIQELLLDSALNEWVKHGVNLFDGKEQCPFCGNKINQERWAEIHAHFDEETKLLTEGLEQLIRQIQTEKEEMCKPISVNQENFYSTLVEDFLAVSAQRELVVSEYCEALDKVIVQLDSRIRQITTCLNFEEVSYDVENIKAIYYKINEVIDRNNNYTSQLGKDQAKAKSTLRLQEVYDFCQTIDYSAIVRNIEKLKEKSDNAEKTASATKRLIVEKESELASKKRQLNDEEEGAQRVNKYLNDYFGHHFVSLEAEKNDEDKRIKFQIKRAGKPAYNLSEGECSLIAFCYFIAKLDDIETNGKKPIIWIDDPISSLDGNHIYFVYSLIMAKIAKLGMFEQLFISTHNMDFLKYLRRLNSYQPDESGILHPLRKQYFLIERMGTNSEIKKMPKYLEKNATEFNYLFSIIYKCANAESITDDNYDMLYSFGNNARKFLEMYLYFKYPNDEDLSPKMKKFFEPEDVPPILIDRMLNEGSHGGAPERLSEMDIDPETIPVARKIIELLRKDSDQYNAFLKSIGESN